MSELKANPDSTSAATATSLRLGVTVLQHVLAHQWPMGSTGGHSRSNRSSTSSNNGHGVAGGSDGGSGGGANAELSARDVKSCAEVALQSLEEGLFARSATALTTVLQRAMSSKADKQRLGRRYVDGVLHSLTDCCDRFDDRLDAAVKRMEEKAEMADQARRQVQLVQASLANAHELVKSLRDDVSEHVKKSDVEQALVTAIKLASSVRHWRRL